jgi:hypothetical protein
MHMAAVVVPLVSTHAYMRHCRCGRVYDTDDIYSRYTAIKELEIRIAKKG